MEVKVIFYPSLPHGYYLGKYLAYKVVKNKLRIKLCLVIAVSHSNYKYIKGWNLVFLHLMQNKSVKCSVNNILVPRKLPTFILFRSLLNDVRSCMLMQQQFMILNISLSGSLTTGYVPSLIRKWFMNGMLWNNFLQLLNDFALQFIMWPGSS